MKPIHITCSLGYTRIVTDDDNRRWGQRFVDWPGSWKLNAPLIVKVAKGFAWLLGMFIVLLPWVLLCYAARRCVSAIVSAKGLIWCDRVGQVALGLAYFGLLVGLPIAWQITSALAPKLDGQYRAAIAKYEERLNTYESNRAERNATIVYHTLRGEKYHRGYHYGGQDIGVIDAIDAGYGRCQVCKPPVGIFRIKPKHPALPGLIVISTWAAICGIPLLVALVCWWIEKSPG